MWNMADCSFDKFGVLAFLPQVLGDSLEEELQGPELRNSVKDTGDQTRPLLNLFTKDVHSSFSAFCWNLEDIILLSQPLCQLKTANDQDRSGLGVISSTFPILLSRKKQMPKQFDLQTLFCHGQVVICVLLLSTWSSLCF